MVHVHAPAPVQTDQHAAHVHNSGETDPYAEADTGHFHLPPTLDHVHDTWIYQAALTGPHTDTFAFRSLGEGRTPRQGAHDRLDKPPRA